MRVLIVGGGVIGAAIAYYLSRRGAQAIVVERMEVACERLRQVGRVSCARLVRRDPARAAGAPQLALHARLAEEIGLHWGYRRLDTFGGVVSSIVPPAA